MTGIDWNEFVDVAYFGSDAFMRYHNKIYQYGGYYDTCYYIYVYTWNDKEVYNSDNNEITKVLEIKSNTNEDIWRQFLNAKIFDGKTLEEAGDDVIFLYWG